MRTQNESEWKDGKKVWWIILTLKLLILIYYNLWWEERRENQQTMEFFIFDLEQMWKYSPKLIKKIDLKDPVFLKIL